MSLLYHNRRAAQKKKRQAVLTCWKRIGKATFRYLIIGRHVIKNAYTDSKGITEMKFQPFIHIFIFLLAIFALPARATALESDSKQLDSFVGFMRLAKDSLSETRYALWHRHRYGPNAETMQKVVFLTTDEAKIKRSMMKTLGDVFTNHATHLGVMENLRDKFETMLERADVKMEERLFLPLILEGCAVYFSKTSTGASIETCLGMGLPKYAGTFDAVGGACASKESKWIDDLSFISSTH